jgi:hypothetical protein
VTHQGVSFYVGMTGTGKTYLALEHLKAAVAENGNPSLILDMVGAKNFKTFPHEATVDAVLQKLYGNPRTHAIYRPRSEAELNQIFNAVGAEDDGPGAVNVLVDEIFWVPCNGHKILTSFSKAIRGWRHPWLGESIFFLTSQRPGDLHGDGYAARDRMYVFRPSEGRDVDRLEKDFGIPREKMLALKEREFILVENRITA